MRKKTQQKIFRRNKDLFPIANFPLRIMRIPKHATSKRQHTHEFDELVIILGGKGKHWVNHEVYELEAGDVFVILDNTEHGYLDTENLSLINILYDSEELQLPQADLGDLPGYHTLFTLAPRIKKHQKFENKFCLTHEQLTQAEHFVTLIEQESTVQTAGFRFTAISHFMQLVIYLSRCYSDLEQEDSNGMPQLANTLSYLEKNYHRSISVQSMLKVAHMSQTSFMRAFRQAIGQSPVDYLIHLRISKSKQLLRFSNISITDAAYNVGFSDSNYFARQFKKIVGCSPKEYRQRFSPNM